MPPRHARQSKVPFGAVISILLVVAATAWFLGGRGGADAGKGAVAGAGGGSSTVSQSGRTDDTVDDSPGGADGATNHAGGDTE